MVLSVLDMCAYVGLVAVGAATLNVLLGVLMAFRYSPWPRRQFNYFKLHNVCGYVALLASIVHPALLLLNKDPKFSVIDLLYPVHSPSQPLENTLGAIAVYLLAIVIVTSYFRIRLGRRLWKAFHFGVYFMAIAVFFHSVLTSPDLKTGPVDWLDGGKVFIEGCLVLVVGAGILRWRHFQQKKSAGRRALREVLTLESDSPPPAAAE